VTINKRVKTFKKSEYKYDLLYNSVMVALNKMNYTIIDHKMDEKYILGKNYSVLYSDTAWGMFGIFPGLYSEINNPVVSIVIQETEDLYNLYLNETTSSTLETTVDNLFNEIRYAYPK